MFRRRALQFLHNWAEKENRKPLVLRGARQVGKTSLVNLFASDFDNYLYLNIERKGTKALFEQVNSSSELLTAIFLFCRKQKKVGRTLLFIDEIQASPEALEQLRYFYEDMPELFVIAAGSLLETLIDSHISFPVGRVEYLLLRPCSFSEFLGAMGEAALQESLDTVSLPAPIHETCMRLFNTYTLIGGMPEVVAHFSKHRDYVALNAIYESLLNGYKDDSEKYATNNTMARVIRYILSEGWRFAAQSITLGNFANSSYKARETGEAFRALEKAMLLELVYPASSQELPIHSELKRAPKLLWLDTGLVNHFAEVQTEVFGVLDIQDAWRGCVAEHIVGQELLAAESNLSARRRFWVRAKQGSDAEVDFIIQYQNKIIPIEVKSGHNAHLKSLHLFMDGVPHDVAIRIWSKPFSIAEVKTGSGKVFRLFNVPFYYSGYLELVLDKYISN